MNIPFINKTSSANEPQHAHSHDHSNVDHSHSHGGDHGHTHEHLDNAGMENIRIYRTCSIITSNQGNTTNEIYLIILGETSLIEVSQLASVGKLDLVSYTAIANSLIMHTRPVGSGKTALTLALCQNLREKYNIATVTNDIFTREDQEFLIKNKALPSERILAIETGGCPHAAIREDVSANLGALETLTAKFGCQILFVESGGDNLAANYSRELADYIIYVIDVSGGDKIPRKGGPGISQSDLLVINKVLIRLQSLCV